MENKDFRVGDKVTRIHVEYGYVLREGPKKEFPELRCGPYSKVYFYHGHEVTFWVKDEESPKRTVTQYVNLYLRPDGRPYSTSGYKSNADAESAAGSGAIASAVKVEIPKEGLRNEMRK